MWTGKEQLNALCEIQDNIMSNQIIDLFLEKDSERWIVLTVLKKKEIMWAQKAKANWLQLGENNTRFFKRWQYFVKRRMKL